MSTAVRTAVSTSYVSTSSEVPAPSEATCASKASRSVSWSNVKEWAAVPTVLMPVAEAGLEVGGAVEPGDHGGAGAAVADSSCVRREPISMQGRSPAAVIIREAAEAMALSWFSTERI